CLAELNVQLDDVIDEQQPEHRPYDPARRQLRQRILHIVGNAVLQQRIGAGDIQWNVFDQPLLRRLAGAGGGPRASFNDPPLNNVVHVSLLPTTIYKRNDTIIHAISARAKARNCTKSFTGPGRARSSSARLRASSTRYAREPGPRFKPGAGSRGYVPGA